MTREYVKGLISQYSEHTANPYFPKRKVAAALHGYKGQIPHWEICRPDYRKRLNKGDYVFFVRKDRSGPARLCTGVLLIIDRLDEARGRKILGDTWFKNYIQSARKHFQEYKHNKKQRHEKLSIKSDRHWRDNILVGHRTKSFWLGKNGVDLSEYGNIVRRKEIQPRKHGTIKSKRRIQRLYQILQTHYKTEGHAHFDNEEDLAKKSKNRRCRC